MLSNYRSDGGRSLGTDRQGGFCLHLFQHKTFFPAKNAPGNPIIHAYQHVEVPGETGKAHGQQYRGQDRDQSQHAHGKLVVQGMPGAKRLILIQAQFFAQAVSISIQQGKHHKDGRKSQAVMTMSAGTWEGWMVSSKGCVASSPPEIPPTTR